MSELKLPELRLKVCETADELRAHLDELNEAGITYIASGMDALRIPFLAFLCGIYADSEGVLSYNPWDMEIDVPGVQKSCDECNAHGTLNLSDLHYPVTVLVAVS